MPGKSDFRRAEHEALQELLQELRSGSKKVVALGGGAFVQKANYRVNRSRKPANRLPGRRGRRTLGPVPPQSEKQGMERPLLGSVEGFRELYEKRRQHYLRASLRLETGGKAVADIVAELIQALDLGPRRGRPRRN